MEQESFCSGLLHAVISFGALFLLFCAAACLESLQANL